MNRRNRNTNLERNSRLERAVMRAVMLAGLVMAGGLWYLAQGAGDGLRWWLPGLVGLSVVSGVMGVGRARARRRWEAAWDAYASDEFEVAAFAPAADEAGLCLAGSR
jgi:hypothetical protein